MTSGPASVHVCRHVNRMLRWLGVIGLLSCGEGGTGSAMRDLPRFRFALSDSTRVVELAWPALRDASKWSVAREPVVAVGGVEGDTVFQRIAHAVRLPDGQIAVANVGGNRIFMFSADGILVDTWGPGPW